jgi:transcriptional regulator with XRE-family HTH domain
MCAHASANTIVPNDVSRELVLTVPLPNDKGRSGDGRSRVHRFRSHWRELGQRLQLFRARYGLAQAEMARVVGAEGHSTVAEWERGVNAPEGIRRERVIDVLEGRRWQELRAAVIDGDGMPRRWNEGARRYRRASRERLARESVGVVVAAILDDLQAVDSYEALRQRYCERDGEWAYGVVARRGLSDELQFEVRRIEDAAYGLRWLELMHGLRFDLCRSLVPQLSPDTLCSEENNSALD